MAVGVGEQVGRAEAGVAVGPADAQAGAPRSPRPGVQRLRAGGAQLRYGRCRSVRVRGELDGCGARSRPRCAGRPSCRRVPSRQAQEPDEEVAGCVRDRGEQLDGPTWAMSGGGGRSRWTSSAPDVGHCAGEHQAVEELAGGADDGASGAAGRGAGAVELDVDVEGAGGVLDAQRSAAGGGASSSWPTVPCEQHRRPRRRPRPARRSRRARGSGMKVRVVDVPPCAAGRPW